jgi:hypothetical protein
MLIKLFHKIIILLLKLIVIALIMVFYTNFLIYFINIDNSGLQGVTFYDYTTHFLHDFYACFIFLILLSFCILISYLFLKNNSYYKANFLRLGSLISVMLCIIFLLSLGGFVHFDTVFLRSVFLVLGSALVGWITAYSFQRILFPYIADNSNLV